MKGRVLILKAGSAAGNNLIRSLRSGDRSLTLIGCNDSRFFLKKSTADRNYVLPPSTADYLPAIATLVERERIDLVIPTDDRDVLRLARHRRKFGRRVFLPSLSLIEQCQDKYALAVFLRERGIPVPLTHPVTDIESIDEVFGRFAPRTKLWCRIRSGSGSFGAIPVDTPDQVRGWIAFWEGMRAVPAEAFTLSEYLPKRDLCVQCLFSKGKMVLAKMAERVTYLGTGSPSGRSSMPALAQTVFDPRAIDICLRAITAIDPRASGIFFVDMKENERGDPCITEINAGRFATMTNIHDLTGAHNMALTYVRIALGKKVRVESPFDFADGYYLVRSVDTVPTVVDENELGEGLRELML